MRADQLTFEGLWKRVAYVGLAILLGFTVNASAAKAGLVFGTPAKLPSSINSDMTADWIPSISADDLTLYWTSGSSRPGFGNNDIWTATRASKSAPWGEPVNLGDAVNTADFEGYPSVSSDGRALYFSRSKTGGSASDSDLDIWMTTRTSESDPWQPAVELDATVNNPMVPDWAPNISSDGLSLIFASTRSGGLGEIDLWMTTREALSGPWNEPVNLGAPINSSSGEGTASLSSDGASLVFASDRSGSLNGWDLWVSTREKPSDPWGEPANLGPTINTTAWDFGPSISSDGFTLYFNAGASLTEALDIWQVAVIPDSAGDMNGDGHVNGLDVDPFVEVLLSGPYQPEADMNEDQVVNGLDVDPFVAAVIGGGVQQIPEPSTLLLCIIALGLVGGWRKWGG
jgi:Tol biopolymer transport system component